MMVVGQVALLIAFVTSGWAAFGCIAGAREGRRALRTGGSLAGLASVLALTVVLAILGRALYLNDFAFSYVARYSSRQLPWHYSMSALWVGQAGSLLLWAWILGVLALVVRPRATGDAQSVGAYGLLMGFLCFLTATMVFAADPMEPNIAPPAEGSGLSPLLQHPAMLIHPPIVFLGYAAWAVPCALMISALACGGPDRERLRSIRCWALFGWAVLGGGILLGARWSYDELGWGGYWAWDPVENGSLAPWLTGTAFVHTLMAWRHRGIFKGLSAGLVIATFGLCNFATFLTRSGIFSSLHAFSQSPIGWLFLGLMIALGLAGGLLILRMRPHLSPERRIESILSREAFVLISTVALLLLAGAAILGTLLVALSGAIVGRWVVVGPEFYNYVLVSTGLVLLAAIAPAPLLQWGSAPSAAQSRGMLASACIASLGAVALFVRGVRHPLGLIVAWLVLCSAAALVACLVIDARRHHPESRWRGVPRALRTGRRQYAGFAVHVGFLCLAIGVTGSSLGARRRDFTLTEGDRVEWAGRSIQFVGMVRSDHAENLIVAAELAITPGGGRVYTLRPAQHFHKLQGTWTTEAAVHPTWVDDFYTILHNGDGRRARFTFVENPLMRWMWFGGVVAGLGALVGLLPEARARGPAARRRRSLGRRAHVRLPGPSTETQGLSSPSVRGAGVLGKSGRGR